jgi:hypothetical protein
MRQAKEQKPKKRSRKLLRIEWFCCYVLISPTHVCTLAYTSIVSSCSWLHTNHGQLRISVRTVFARTCPLHYTKILAFGSVPPSPTMSQSLEEVMAQFTANSEQLRTHLLKANAMSNELTQLRTQADAMRTELAERPTLATVEELRLRLDALSAVAAPPPRGSYLKVNTPQECCPVQTQLRCVAGIVPFRPA